MATITKVIRKRAKAVTRLRPGATTTVNGYRTSAAPASDPIQAHIQPMSPKELRNVPEGQNTMEWVSVWSLFDLQENDKIVDGGKTYEVQRFKDRGDFFKAEAVRVVD